MASTTSESRAELDVSTRSPDELCLSIRGRLDAHETAAIWRSAIAALERARPAQLTVDAAGLDYCDGAGLALLIELRRRQEEAGKKFELVGLPERIQPLLAQFKLDELHDSVCHEPKPRKLTEEVGKATVHLWLDFRHLVEFVGELSAALVRAILKPRTVRWKDAFLLAETAGINALPIVALVSFLIGVILAFQSAAGMKQFGADIFVANLVALAVLRELGPLMTAVLLAGRSGSSYAAELGTMRINEEVDALTTFGLDPVRFLVTTRVIALVAITPLLTVFADFLGLVGGGVVFCSFDYPMVTYIKQIQSQVGLSDFLGGVFKSFVFGILVAAIGCLRGLQTKTGPSAVGDSATRAVVSGILLIVIADGVFSVLFYLLDI